MSFAARDRIAVIKPCCIGDCVMTQPVIGALQSAFPDARISVFVGPHSGAVFEMQTHVDRQTTADQVTPAAAARLVRDLYRLRPRLVINLDRSRVLRLALRTYRLGQIVTSRWQYPETRHETDVYLDAIAQLNLPILSREPSLSVRPTPSERAVILHVGGAQNPGTTMLTKRWPASHYEDLARKLDFLGYVAWLSAGPDELELCREIAERAGIPDRRILSGKVGLVQLAGHIAGAMLFVGPDTGVSHIAAALGTPSVVIFGPTNPTRYAPRGPAVRVLAPAESWAITDRDLRKDQPAPDPPSTADVSVDEVLAAISDLIGCADG